MCEWIYMGDSYVRIKAKVETRQTLSFKFKQGDIS